MAPIKQLISITFDDGPDEITNTLLDTLKRHNATATFFVLGSQVAKRPETIKRAHEEGHIIAGHHYTHEHSPLLTMEEFNKQVDATISIIEKTIGDKIKYYRPPYGEVTDEQQAELSRRGLISVYWNGCSYDFDENINTVEEITKRGIGAFRDNAVILFHDGRGKPTRERTLIAMDKILTAAKERNYHCVGVDQIDQNAANTFGDWIRPTFVL